MSVAPSSPPWPSLASQRRHPQRAAVRLQRRAQPLEQQRVPDARRLRHRRHLRRQRVAAALAVVALIVVRGDVLCGGVALKIARRIKPEPWNAARPLGDIELSAVDAVPIAAVTILDEEDSAGVWAAPATADPGSLSGVKTEMANGVPEGQL